jgi:hypothetical protein
MSEQVSAASSWGVGTVDRYGMKLVGHRNPRQFGPIGPCQKTVKDFLLD